MGKYHHNSRDKREYRIERKIKRWWARCGQYIFSFEVIGIIVIIVLLIYFWRTRTKSEINSGYGFQGLSRAEIDRAKKMKLDPSLRRKTRNAPRWKHEEMCRNILEKIFNKPFKSCRPKFLKNPVTGQNLEIDCFNEQLRIGLEYDGVQHSKYTPHFHRSGKAEFLYQLKKDQFKDMVCKREGITLIRIPHFVHHTDLERFITNKLRQSNKLPGWYK